MGQSVFRTGLSKAGTWSNEIMHHMDWLLDRVYRLAPAKDITAEFLQTFKEFPPRQKAASFAIDQAMDKLTPKGG